MKLMDIVKDNVALFIPTQITKFLVIKSAEVLELPKDKVVCQIEKYGNLSSSNIPFAISQAIESGTLKIGAGQKIVYLGISNGVSLGLVYMQI